MVGASVTYTARAVLTDGLDGGLRLRTLLEAPDVPTQNCDRRADQRGRDEEPLEAQAFDDEARGAREQAPGQGAERGQKCVLARRVLRRGKRDM